MENKHNLAKWLADEMSEEELKAFMQHKDYELYKRIKDNSSRLKSPSFNSQELLQKVLQEKKKAAKSKKVLQLSIKQWWNVAAIFIVSLTLVLTYQLSYTNVTASNSEQLAFLLPDESEVILQTNASITYHKWFWNFERKLNLTGEAFFKVKKGKKFQVTNGLGTVEVLGTQFLVSDANERFEVICYEGSVKVSNSNNTKVLSPGDAIVFDENKKAIFSTNKINFPIWVSNALEFSFVNSDLSQIIERLEKHYNIQIEKPSDVAINKFTGKLPKNNLQIALKIVASTYDFELIKVKESVYKFQVKR